MKSCCRTHRAFTLVELLVVIGIIGVLIGILLPVLSRAREAANTIRCGSNLHQIGQGMFVYVVDNKGYLPASNYWRQVPGQPVPSRPVNGTIHWSSFLYSRKDLSNSTNVYLSPSGWEMFQCPSLPDGGLPPANTYAGNSPLSNEASGNVIDAQAPRLAYTVNEALCPRGFFVDGATMAGAQVQRAYRYVHAATVRFSSATILATELPGVLSVMEYYSLVDGTTVVSFARRPVSGFTSALQGPENLWQLPNGGAYSWLFPINHATVDELSNDPQTSLNANITPTTTLDWVGRNHGKRSFDNTGFDLRKTNFLFLDGHVETKNIRDTLKPVSQWGDQFYSLEGGDYVQ